MSRSSKAITAFILSAALASASGCVQGNTPAENAAEQNTTTTAAEAVTESIAESAASETTTAAESTSGTTASEITAADETTEAQTADEPASEAAQTDITTDIFPLRYGVWLAVDGDYGSEYYDESYYCFNEDGSGSVLSQSMGIGVPFRYVQDGDDPTKWLFEMAAVDSLSRMEVLELDDDTMRIKWDAGDTPLTLTYIGTPDEFSFYDNYSLGLMAQHLFDMSLESVDNETVETAFESDKISVIIRDQSIDDNTNSILKWYYIDRYTGKGFDSDGNDVDLTMFEGEWAEMPYPNTFSSMPAIKELGTLRENDEMLGFWYIGYVEPDMDDFDNFRDLYLQIFERTGMNTKVRYVNSFPSDSFVTGGGGQELYLLLPSDIHGCVTVSELVYDEAAGELKEGGELFRQDDNLRPILLKCNRSEIMPDVLVRVTDSNGELLEWSPSISGMDGSVVTDNDTLKAIHDFTDYSSLMHPDSMPEAMG